MTRTITDLVWPRRTQRLTLRPARLSDLEVVFAYRSDPEVAQWLTSLPRTVEELAPKILDRNRTLVIEREGELIGDLMLAVQNSWSQSEVADQATDTQAEIGWCLSPAHRGQGFATEAIRELITIAFELGVHRIEAGCFAENVASRRVMDLVGLRQEGHHLKESLHRDGTWRDAMSFALLAEEWLAGR